MDHPAEAKRVRGVVPRPVGVRLLRRPGSGAPGHRFTEGEKPVKKSLRLLGLIVLLGLLALPAWAQSPGPTSTTMSGKINLNIVGVTYDTLVLVNCFNVDLINCTVKNLVLVRCWNVDVVDSAFVGEGVAVVADTCMAVAITRCLFSEAYSERLIKIRSSKVSIE